MRASIGRFKSWSATLPLFCVDQEMVGASPRRDRRLVQLAPPIELTRECVVRIDVIEDDDVSNADVSFGVRRRVGNH